jgi:hypothetical protein
MPIARSSAVYITLTNEPPDGDLDFATHGFLKPIQEPLKDATQELALNGAIDRPHQKILRAVSCGDVTPSTVGRSACD